VLKNENYIKLRKSEVQTLFIFFSLGTNDNTSLQSGIFESF